MQGATTNWTIADLSNPPSNPPTVEMCSGFRYPTGWSVTALGSDLNRCRVWGQQPLQLPPRPGTGDGLASRGIVGCRFHALAGSAMR